MRPLVHGIRISALLVSSCALGAIVPGVAHAQPLPPEALPPLGERIRVTHIGGDSRTSRTAGRLDVVEANSILMTVRRKDDIRLDFRGVVQLEESLGRSHALGVIRGLAIGALTGATIGTVLGAVDPEGCGGCDTRGGTMIIAALGLGFYGAVGGTVLGGLIGVERWEVTWSADQPF